MSDKRQPGTELESDSYGPTFYDSTRTPRSGPGRRAEDVEVRELIHNAAFRKVVWIALTVLGMAASAVIADMRAASAYAAQLRGEITKEFRQTYSDDIRERIVRLEASDRIKGEVLQNLFAEQKEQGRTLDTILRELRKK